MTPLRRAPIERWWLTAAGGAGLVAAALASFTSPFTEGAEVITAVPLAVGLFAVILRLRSDRYAAGGMVPEEGAAPDSPRRRWALGWPVLVAAVAGWELYCYVSSPRSAHPTLSVLIDLLDGTPTGKFVAFLLWLILGWVLVGR
jgi:hypothetical protein